GSVVVSNGLVQTFTGANSYLGGTTINPGSILGLGNNTAAGAGLITNTTGGTLRFSADALTILNNVSLTGGGNNNFAVGTVGGVTTAQISGNVTGNGNFVKVGGGTLVLAGTNAWSGSTDVQAGNLVFAGSTVINGAYTIAAAASMTVNSGKTATVTGLLT